MWPSRRNRSWPVAAHERDVQQLDRGASFEAAVAALGQPHAAHAALADARDQTVRAEGLSRQRRQPGLRRQRDGALEETRLVERVVLRKQRPQVGGEGAVLRSARTPARPRDPRRTCRARDRVGPHRAPAFRAEGRHRPQAAGFASVIARCR